jgi:hypothetical protein
MSQEPQAVPLTAGAQVRISIETTVESLNDHELTLTGGTTITYTDPAALGLSVLIRGWEPGDIVDDGYGWLLRVRRDDGVDVWQRADGMTVYDDETSLASLRVVARASNPDYVPPGDYVRSDGVRCCVHAVPVGPGSCPDCWDLAKWDHQDTAPKEDRTP